NDGTLTGTTSVSGEAGGGRHFAVNDVFAADGSGTLNLSGNEVSIEAWIKLENSPSTSQTFTAEVGKTTFPNNQAYLIAFESGSAVGLPQNQWRFEYILTNSSGTRVHNQLTGVDVTVDGLYHHFAMTYDGANVRLYVDSALRGTFAFTGKLEAVPSEPFRIFGAAPFSIDELAVYNRPPNPAEIQTIYTLRGASKGGATIQGNFVGTNAAGTAPLASGGNGVTITNAAGNTIGGTVAAARNLISGNANDGMEILGTTATQNLVQGNYVGTDATGTSSLGN